MFFAAYDGFGLAGQHAGRGSKDRVEINGPANEKVNRARQLYKNIYMLFLFPVKDSKLSTGVIAIFNASCYG